MSISTTESLQSVRMLDELNAKADRQAAADAELHRLFELAIIQGDPDATPEWTGTCPDYETAVKLKLEAWQVARRRIRIGEAFRESLDYRTGPDIENDILRLVSAAVKSSDPQLSEAAAALVKRCGDMYVRYNSPEVEE